MICYRDMTFCSYYKKCKSGKTCPRAFTAEVAKNAKEWWGSEDVPICLFAEKPNCHKILDKEEEVCYTS